MMQNVDPSLLPSPVPLWNPEDPNPPGGRGADMPCLLPFLPAERHGFGVGEDHPVRAELLRWLRARAAA